MSLSKNLAKVDFDKGINLSELDSILGYYKSSIEQFNEDEYLIEFNSITNSLYRLGDRANEKKGKTLVDIDAIKQKN